ncbi:MFS transporter [Candidatus Woesearchaeota archaeon]|nr:MFS transporter [Candidatus Woesearchaeota archaeon]
MQVPSKKEIWSWAFYDFANSSYGFVVASMLFPIFYRTFLAGNTGQADFYWGLSFGISVALAALACPIIGAFADQAKNKKQLLILSTVLCIIGTALLYFTPWMGLLFASILFILTNFMYTVGAVLYDSFLMDIASHHNKGRVSGFAWGLGYIGGLVALIVLIPLFIKGFEGPNLGTYLLTFPGTALFFLIFALPAFIFLRSHRHPAASMNVSQALPAAFKSLFETLKNWRLHKNVLLFLAAFYLLSDGLNTIFSFTAIYATVTLGLSVVKTMLVIATVYVVGFPATVITGRLADRWGCKSIIMASSIGWVIVVILLMLKPSFEMLMGVAVLTGIVIGSSQAPARTLLAKLVPEDKASQFFGFNGLASKISASLGPVLFGAVSWWSGSQVVALGSIIPFFVASIIVLLFVREDQTAQS